MEEIVQRLKNQVDALQEELLLLRKELTSSEYDTELPEIEKNIKNALEILDDFSVERADTHNACLKYDHGYGFNKNFQFADLQILKTILEALTFLLKKV